MVLRIRRALLVALAAVLALNLVTGAPVLALRAGAVVQGGSFGVRMESVVTVVVPMAVLSAALVRGLVRVGAAYDRAAGHAAGPPRQPSWLRPFNAPPTEAAADAPMRALEAAVVLVVVLTAVAFEAWFLFFAGSPLP